MLRLLPPLFGLLAVLLALVAYQGVRSQSLAVGNAGDTAFVGDTFNGDEADISYRYRWSKAHSEVAFVGTGNAAPSDVLLDAQGFRPGTAPTPVTMTLSLNGVALEPSVVTLTQRMEPYTFHAPPDAHFTPGSWTVSLDTGTFTPPGDTRELGIKVSSVRLTQVGGGLNLPPAWLLFWALVWVVGVVYLLAALPGVVGRVLSLVGGLVAVLLPLVLPRLYVGAYLPPVAAVVGLAALLHWQRSHLALWAEWVDGLGHARVARGFMLGAMLLYAAVCLWALPQVDWIGHADYAENAVIARNFVHGRGLSVDYVAQFYDPHPSLTHPAETWPLLQPILIAPFFAVLGTDTWVARLPNLLIVLGLAWLVFTLAGRLWDARVGLLAGLPTLLHPYFFNAVLYPINDLAFTAIFFGLAWLIWRLLAPRPDESPPDKEEPLQRPPAHTRRLLGISIGIGALAGLLVWSKPSGGALLVGLAGWAVWRGFRGYRLRGGALHVRALLPALPALAVLAAFGIVLLPLVARNFLAFGKPFFSTEGYDAWILRYWPVHEWEDIYKVYVGGEQPSFRWVLGGKFGYSNLFQAIGYNLGWVWQKGVIGEQGSSDFVFGLLPLAGALVGLASATRRVGSLFGMVFLCIGLYGALVLLYWHYEGRYFQVAVPWLYMLLAWGVFWLWDRLRAGMREGLGRRWGLFALPLAVAALVWPSLSAIGTQIAADTQPTGFVTAMQWLRQNSPPTAVIMTRDPWELNWYSERRAVMIPNDDLATVNRIAGQYGVTYLQLGGPVDGIDTRECPEGDAPESKYPTGIRPLFGRLYCGREKPGYKLVYRAGGLTIYRLVGK